MRKKQSGQMNSEQMKSEQMKTSRGFIFSLDAFISFTLAIAAIYSLIFFSSIPSSYYYVLTQGHYLTHDVLLASSTTKCTSAVPAFLCANREGSLLENIAFSAGAGNRRIIENSLALMIPEQFGFIVEIGKDSGSGSVFGSDLSFTKLYDRSTDSSEGEIRAGLSSRPRRFSVSSESVVFGFPSTPNLPANSPYRYNTCGAGGAEIVGTDVTIGTAGTAETAPIITCGNSLNNYPGFSGTGITAGAGTGGFETGVVTGGTTGTDGTGLVNNVAGTNSDYLIPGVESRVIRLTIYI